MLLSMLVGWLAFRFNMLVGFCKASKQATG
jgi:hypothetical protein